MKTKCLVLVVILIVFTGCSKVKETVGSVNEAQDTYSESKKQAEDVIQGVENSKQALDDIDINALGELKSIEDISAFGEYKAAEFISRNEESISDGYFTDYYSSADFDEVVGYYKSKFKKTNDFDITEYPDSYVQMSGFVGDVFIQFDIQREDENTTYVMYQYESPEQIANADSSTGENSGLTAEEFECNIDDYIDTVIGNDDIKIREEIGKLDYQEWKEEWDVWYPENLTVKIEGGGLSYDFTDYNGIHNDGELFYDIEYDCYFKGVDFNILSTYKGGVTRKTRMIYDGDADITTIIGQDGYKMSQMGNSAPIRLLDLSYFEAFESENQDYEVLKDMGIEVLLDDQFRTQYIEKKNGDRFMVGSFYHKDSRTYTQGTFVYSFDLRIIISYEEIGTELEYCNHHMNGTPMIHSVGWKVTGYDDTTIVDKKLLDQNNYEGEYINVEE